MLPLPSPTRKLGLRNTLPNDPRDRSNTRAGRLALSGERKPSPPKFIFTEHTRIERCLTFLFFSLRVMIPGFGLTDQGAEKEHGMKLRSLGVLEHDERERGTPGKN